jgi:hypothetical protein
MLVAIVCGKSCQLKAEREKVVSKGDAEKQFVRLAERGGFEPPIQLLTV